ncbi:MAG: NADH-quinone oxidoreductase subunit M [Actinobacteria bacterium]|nr:MAG: NADH-quinone oxidoreductase subunit M [Actinomycetota bacterium]
MTLSILIWLPLAIAVVAGQLPARITGRLAAAGSLVTLGIAISFLARFKLSHPGLQFVTDQVWISALGIHYKLGLDGLNVSLVVLGCLLFSAMWGTGERVRATTKLVVYTLVGSFFMLAGAIATGALASSQHGTPLTFALSSLQHLPLSHGSQEWIFLAFAAAFLVKMPLIPFHGWLADGYKSMPIPAVAVFSGILSKVAAYGFLRIVLPLFPFATVHFQLLMLLICLVSILWSTSVAFTTPDARLVVAYSSVAQLSFITLGIFSLRSQGAQGALLQMLNHGLVTAPLFFIVAALAARAGGSEKLSDMGGIAFRAPVLASLFLIVAFATLAMPGSSNFIGEFLILLGVFRAKLAISVIAFLGVVGAAFYALRVFIGAMHNRPRPRVASRGIGISDFIPMGALALVILVFAFYPQFGLKRSEPTVNATVSSVVPPRAIVASPVTPAAR